MFATNKKQAKKGEQPAMTPKYSKQAKKRIEGMDTATKQRIRKAISKIPEGDIKPLRGYPGLFRLRVGDWRIVFSYIDKETVLIERISPRRNIYDEFTIRR